MHTLWYTVYTVQAIRKQCTFSPNEIYLDRTLQRRVVVLLPDGPLPGLDHFVALSRSSQSAACTCWKDFSKSQATEIAVGEGEVPLYSHAEESWMIGIFAPFTVTFIRESSERAG